MREEMNREICFFHSRTNGCRHGSECTKMHPGAARGRVVVVKGLYLYPRNDPQCTLDSQAIQLHVDLFCEDWFTEMSLKYGAVRRIVIASNSCSQLLGNVYIEFYGEEDAARCVEGLGRRSYSGKKILAELGNCCRVDDAICTDHRRGSCAKGEQCSFVHEARVSSFLLDELFASQDVYFRGGAGLGEGSRERRGPRHEESSRYQRR